MGPSGRSLPTSLGPTAALHLVRVETFLMLTHHLYDFLPFSSMLPRLPPHFFLSLFHLSLLLFPPNLVRSCKWLPANGLSEEKTDLNEEWRQKGEQRGGKRRCTQREPAPHAARCVFERLYCAAGSGPTPEANPLPRPCRRDRRERVNHRHASSADDTQACGENIWGLQTCQNHLRSDVSVQLAMIGRYAHGRRRKPGPISRLFTTRVQ